MADRYDKFQNPAELVRSRLAASASDLMDHMADSAVGAVKRRIDDRMNPQNPRKGTPSQFRAGEDEYAEDENEYEEGENAFVDGDEAGLPFCFEQPGSALFNLECAAAAWKLLGVSDDECEEGDDPDIVAQYQDGRAFVGSVEQWQGYCEENDVTEQWTVYGLDANDDYDASEIRKIPVSKKTLNYVQAAAMNADLREAKANKAGFHWNEGGGTTSVMGEIPGLDEGATLSFLGVAENILYTARKGNEVATYTHQFGEDAPSGVKPKVYALIPKGSPPGYQPTCVLIFGGDMVVEDRGIVH